MSTVTTIGAQLENFDSARRPVKAYERKPGPYPYLGASGVVDYVDGYTHDGVFLCVSEDGENLRSRKTPIAWVQGGRFWANNHLHVLGGVSLPRARFFCAALEQAPISSYLTGSAQPKLSQASLNAIVIPEFTSDQQRAIGEVLGALDDKIAANRRVIEATRELVAALAASSPATVSFGSIARRTGKSISPREMGALDVAHFSLPAFDQGNVSYEQPDSIRSNKTRLEEPVLLISKLNPRIPRIWPIDKLPHAVSVCSTEFISFAPISGISVADLWAASLNPDFSRQLETLVTGTTGSHQRLQPDEIARVIIHDPRRLSLEQRAILMNSCRLQGELADENTVIASTRDELLPLLMSGKITVRDAELAAEEAL